MREFIGATAFVMLCSLDPTEDASLVLIAAVYVVLILALVWAWMGGDRGRDQMRVRHHR